MKSFMIFLAFAFAALSIGFATYGLRFMYDDSYSNQVVGGDAYNYIIYATRGTAYVCAGIVNALLAVLAAMMSRILED